MSRVLSTLFAVLAVVGGGCHGHDHGEDLDAVYLDEASDEVLLTLLDLVDRGEVTIDASRAPSLTTPTGGEVMSAGAPFSWEPPVTTRYHGRATGDFVWMRIDCDGMAEPVDVLAIETMTWTPDPDHWSKIASAGGGCTVELTGAYADRGVVSEGGPYRSGQVVDFTVAAQQKRDVTERR